MPENSVLISIGLAETYMGNSIAELKEDRDLVNEIEETVLPKLTLGFDPRVFSILDDNFADEKKFRTAQDYLSQPVLGHLLQMGNSLHFARAGSGEISSFPMIVNRLGVKLIRMIIASSSLFLMMNREEEKKLFARSLSISLLSKLIAMSHGYNTEFVNKAELSGLFFEIGKMPLIQYGRMKGKRLDETFFNNYWQEFSVKIIQQFNLPDFIYKPIEDFCIVLDEKDLDLGGIVYTAWSSADRSFSHFGKLHIRAPLPDEDSIVQFTYASDIECMFQIYGISNYLEIDRVLTERQQMFLSKKQPKQS